MLEELKLAGKSKQFTTLELIRNGRDMMPKYITKYKDGMMN